MSNSLPNAEDLNYWKTSKSQPGTWLDRTESVIEDLGGEVQMRARGKKDGREAYLLQFTFGPDQFRIVWPVLPTRTNSQKAAERQAATMMYHDCKARALRCKIHGPKIAFFEYLMLGDGRTAGQLSAPELAEHTPKPLLPGQ